MAEAALTSPILPQRFTRRLKRAFFVAVHSGLTWMLQFVLQPDAADASDASDATDATEISLSDRR